MWVVACTPILVMVSSAQPTKSLGNSRNGRPRRRTSSLAAAWRLCLILTRMKKGSWRLNAIGFERSMIFMSRLLFPDNAIAHPADALDADLDQVARGEKPPDLDAAAAGKGP